MAANIPVPNPRTYSDLDSIDYRDMKDNIFDALSMKLKPPMCHVRRTTNFALTSQVITTVTWDYVVADTGPMMDLSVDATKIIPNVAGRYKVMLGAYFLPNASVTGGRAILWPRRNNSGGIGGTGQMYRFETRLTSFHDKRMIGSGGYIYFNGTTDYLLMEAYQDSGFTMNIGPYASPQVDNTFMYIRWESAL